MSKTVNVVLYGVGYMGKLITRYMHNNGYNIVGAINRTSNLGEDLGLVAGLEKDLGVTISNSADEIYKNNQVDIAVVSTSSDMESFLELARDVIPRGVNLLTIAEEVFWPWKSNPSQCEELDKLAREHNVTVTASGLQDGLLLNVISAVTGTCNRIDSLSVVTNANLDFYGPAVLEHYIIGATENEYESIVKQAGSDNERMPVLGSAMEALTADLGCTVKHWNCYYTPIFASEQVRSVSLDKVIDAGLSIGVVEHIEIKTEEGISLNSQFVEEICSPEKPSQLTWDIKGTPDISFSIDRLDGEAVTCASAVNRILDVIDAAPGFVTCENLPRMKLKV